MAALRNQQAIPAPGDVLRLKDARSVPHAVYIRDCYEELANVVLNTPGTDFILTGTPGTGKSLFFYYFVQRLLQLPRPPPFIIWEHASYRLGFCYNTKTGEVLRGEVYDFKGLYHPEAWYIADGVPPELGGDARLLLITSPKRKTYKEVKNLNALMLYMPLWSLAELLACRSKLDLPVSEALVTKCFEHGGGVASFSLSQRGVMSEASFGRLLEELRGAVNSCSVSEVRAALVDAWSHDSGPEAIHRLIHITTDSTYCERQPVFASLWVAGAFMAKAQVEDPPGLARMVNSTLDTSLRGLLHEARMHLLLPKGGAFTVAPVELTDGVAKLERGTEGVVELPACKRVTIFEELAEVAADRGEEGVYYYKPASATSPLVDSLLRAAGVMFLFQMAVDGGKLVDFAALAALLRELGLAPQQEARLVYVVPEDVYPDFKLTVEMGNEGRVQQAAPAGRRSRKKAPALAPALPPVPTPAALAPRPKLYVMRVPRAKLEVRALAARGGRHVVRARGGLWG
ncbi:hypothetical protein HXX76_015071 [Chlamydomonas incerta]|uniref:Uncharacterized protein n=1 Tax=Chlamydomonas incerta TaxID=51695 RepID=A0A835SNA2_CHLIN|nr:hypothetical protein HXX76_015071 [Chlamydomonas incerta]|eukprot:KAG2423795.1 hypothetical protein HXX76_015071 [Chlamydomonas incerta]